MVFFNNKNEMIKATDDEIREFFSNTVFEGVFSKEIKSNYPEYFKGHIHSIKINGVENNVIGTFVNVPNYANDIPEGPCTFKCRLKDEVRISPSQIAFSLSPKTLRSPNSIISASSFIKKKHDIEPLEQELYDAWGVDNAQIIGYYHHDDEKDRNVIDDIRKPNFVHLTSSLFCAITWRVLKINELRQKYGWLWVAQAKKCTFVPCMYARNITDQVPQAWLLSARPAANIRR